MCMCVHVAGRKGCERKHAREQDHKVRLSVGSELRIYRIRRRRQSKFCS